MRIIIFLCCLLTHQLNANEFEKVRIIAVNEPPANFINKTGLADGFVVEIVQAMQTIIGNNINIEFVPEARSLNIVATKPNILFFSLSRTEFREDSYYWIGKVFNKNWQVFAKTDSALIVDSLAGLSEISSIGVVRGDVREEWLVNKKFTNLYSLTHHEQSIQLLLHDRLPAIVYEQQGLDYWCHKLAIDPLKFKAIYTLHQSDVYLVMSKTTPKETVLLWQQAYEKLLLSGQISAISQKWHQSMLNNFNIQSNFDGDFLTF